jgi:hypothetical protein
MPRSMQYGISAASGQRHRMANVEVAHADEPDLT